MAPSRGKISCAPSVRGMAYSLFTVNHSDTSHSWASVRSFMWKMVDIAFPRVCYAALWRSLGSSSKSCPGWHHKTWWKYVSLPPPQFIAVVCWHMQQERISQHPMWMTRLPRLQIGLNLLKRMYPYGILDMSTELFYQTWSLYQEYINVTVIEMHSWQNLFCMPLPQGGEALYFQVIHASI